MAARHTCTISRTETLQLSCSRQGMQSSFFGNNSHSTSQWCPLRSQPLVSRSRAGLRGVVAMAAPARKGKGGARPEFQADYSYDHKYGPTELLHGLLKCAVAI